MPPKIAICDDEPAQAKLFAEMAREWAALCRFPVEIALYHSAEAFLFAWETDKSFFLLLLDIQMGGISGMELAQKLRREGAALSIVFLTGIPDCIAQGYEVEALHYLLKPVSREKLFSCLDRASRRIPETPCLLLSDVNGEAVRLAPREIRYIESFAHTAIIHTQDSTVEVRAALSALEGRLPAGQFVRCHRSYLVGLHAVARIGKTELYLDGGARLPVSRRLFPALSQAFVRYYRPEGESEWAP